MSATNSETKGETDLTLYMFSTCPYCRRVMSALNRLDMEVEYRNIHVDESYREELVEARGKPTVPVLRIAASRADGSDEWMGESADIVEYLADRFGDGELPPRRLGDYLTDWKLWVIAGGFVALVMSLL